MIAGSVNGHLRPTRHSIFALSPVPTSEAADAGRWVGDSGKWHKRPADAAMQRAAFDLGVIRQIDMNVRLPDVAPRQAGAEVDHQLGKLIAYSQPAAESPRLPSGHLTVGRVPTRGHSLRESRSTTVGDERMYCPGLQGLIGIHLVAQKKRPILVPVVRDSARGG